MIITYGMANSQIMIPRIDTKPIIKSTKDKSLELILDSILKANRIEISATNENKLKELASKYSKHISNFERPSYVAEIDGLGNISNSQNGQGLSPSANIFVGIKPIPDHPVFKIYAGFNLGSNLDSTNLDSIKLGKLFLPDRGQYGFLGRIEYDMLSLIKTKIKSKGSVEKENGYQFSTQLNLFIEYNFNKINIKQAVEDSSSIQTSTWIKGINFSWISEKENNSIGLQVAGFHKTVVLTDGTLGVYRNIFDKTLKKQSPSKVNFLGLSVGLQINRFLFSFIIEDLQGNYLKESPLWGGVYTLKATVAGDFWKF